MTGKRMKPQNPEMAWRLEVWRQIQSLKADINAIKGILGLPVEGAEKK